MQKSVLPIVAIAVLVAVAFVANSGKNPSGYTSSAVERASHAIVTPSISAAVIVEVESGATAPNLDVTCQEEREKGYSFDASAGRLTEDSYRIVRKCSDGSETVVKDWTPTS